MAGRDVIVVGASAGGVEALLALARGLPPGFPASVFVVCHFPPGGRSVLPQILGRAGPLPVAHPSDGEAFQAGRIYVAPPDHHLLLAPDGRIRLSRDARENHHRPAVDPLFRSAARHFGPRVIGVILTGSLYDGTAGLMAIRGAGGLAVVQDPSDALVAAMPQNAVQIAGTDFVAPIAEIPRLLARLVHDRDVPTPGVKFMDPIEQMPELAERDMDRQVRNERRGQLTTFTCPECGGSLWQVDQPEMVQFRCHVGHTYNAEILLSEQTEALEAALWTAVRTFREKSILALQLANQERAGGNEASAARFDEQARQAARYGSLIRDLLIRDGYGSNDPDGDDPGGPPA